jgi:hypothetical protein
MLVQPRFWSWAFLSILAATAVAIPAFGGGAGRQVSNEPPLIVTVEYGDCLWTIARKHGDPRRDVREIVYEMQLANSVDPERLRPGSALLIPDTCLPTHR